MLNIHVFYASNMVVVRIFEITLTYPMYDFKVLNSVKIFFKGKVFSLLSLPSCLACIIILSTLLPEGRTMLK